MSRNHHERDEHGNVPWSSKDSQKWRKIIAPTLPARCVNPRKCGGALVYPDQLWDVGHIGGALKQGDKTPGALGPAHRSCNRSDGGREGAKKTNTQRATNKRHGFG